MQTLLNLSELDHAKKAAVAASAKLAPVVQAIVGAIRTAPVVHADETGMKALHWMHTAVTASLTFIARHTKRGQEAFEAIGILPAYRGTLKRDGWMPYRSMIKQSKALNLIDRLRLHADDVWRFATNVGVPFTNNLAEQAVRKPQSEAKNLRLLSNRGGCRCLLNHQILPGDPAKTGTEPVRGPASNLQSTPPMLAFG